MLGKEQGHLDQLRAVPAKQASSTQGTGRSSSSSLFPDLPLTASKHQQQRAACCVQGRAQASNCTAPAIASDTKAAAAANSSHTTQKPAMIQLIHTQWFDGFLLVLQGYTWMTRRDIIHPEQGTKQSETYITNAAQTGTSAEQYRHNNTQSIQYHVTYHTMQHGRTSMTAVAHHRA